MMRFPPPGSEGSVKDGLGEIVRTSFSDRHSAPHRPQQSNRLARPCSAPRRRWQHRKSRNHTLYASSPRSLLDQGATPAVEVTQRGIDRIYGAYTILASGVIGLLWRCSVQSLPVGCRRPSSKPGAPDKALRKRSKHFEDAIWTEFALAKGWSVRTRQSQ